jgi:processive 1,2-diacylglycerol beta-glucosyltransferase
MGRRAVVLSGSLGMGHDVVADAVSNLLAADGWQAPVLDCMALLGDSAGRSGERAFRALIAAGGAYDLLYFAHLRADGRVARGLDGLAARRLVPALRAEFARTDPELVVSLFPTAASAAARLAAEQPARRTVVLCTDAAAHRLWVAPGTDLYLLTSPAAAASVRRYQPQAAVRLLPRPVRPEFLDPPDRAAARRALGVPPDARCALLMGGGWGLGPLEAASRGLAASGVHVLAVAGRNAALAGRLAAVAAADPRVAAFGVTDRVAELMAAADVVVTAPGSNTCAEARAVGRRLVLIDILPGHGRENVQREMEAGHADVTGPDAGALVGVVRAALDRAAAGEPGPEPDRADWTAELRRVLGTDRAAPGAANGTAVGGGGAGRSGRNAARRCSRASGR